MTDDSNIIQLREVGWNPQLIDLSREELTMISDVMRRLEPIRRGLPPDQVAIFVTRPEFASAPRKIDDGKVGDVGGACTGHGGAATLTAGARR